jgi:tetratricopeptide (TPR) repeat protein
MTQALTVAEKILFHLYQYIKSEDKYEVPFDVTQDGIAQSCGISRAHAAIELKKLREGEQIVEKLSHVRRAKSRRKVYFLTPDGKAKATKIVEHVKAEKVETGVDASRISQGTGPAKRARRHSSAIPQPKQFFGRGKELSSLVSLVEDDAAEIVVVTGLGGIGKTALLSKFAKESKSSVFWFSLNEWETELSLLKAFAEFLEESGDNRLMNYLKSDRIDLGEVGYLLGEALAENRKVMILDDIDKAPRLEALVKMMLSNMGPNKIFVTAESRPALIDELKGEGKPVHEIALSGLDIEAATELLRARGISGEKAERLCDLTGCHAMLLGLVPADDESSARLEMSNFVKKTLLKELPSGDMSIIERCSVFRKPFSPNLLSRDERHVLKLPIFYQISDSYGLHEMVRRIVVDQIPEAERIEYNSRAADYRLGEGDLAERLYHLIESGRYLESERLIHSRSSELLSAESPQNLLVEVKRIPPRVSRYTSSVQLIAARASAMLGDERGAIDRLLKIAEAEKGDDKANALLELANRSIDDALGAKVFKEMKSLLEDQSVSTPQRSRIAYSLANALFSKGDLEESERYIAKGLSYAASGFSLDAISSLNRLQGQILLLKGRYKEAVSFLGQTAPSFSGQHRPLYHRLLAKAFAGSGDSTEARRTIESGVRIAEENGQYKELADSLLDLCGMRLAEGDAPGAAESCYRCIEVSSSIGENGTLCNAYANLSSIEERRGNGKEAEEARAAAISISKEHGLTAPFDLPKL